MLSIYDNEFALLIDLPNAIDATSKHPLSLTEQANEHPIKMNGLIIKHTGHYDSLGEIQRARPNKMWD